MKFPEDFRHEGGVWYPKERGNVIAYTDGSSVEHYLEKVLGSASDLSSTSLALRDAIRDWPSRYHLSAERSNLIRCLAIEPAARVLEIGAGCGAITRYLAEQVSEVCAVEGSVIRARLCRLRCRDLERARVIAGDVFKLELDETFDIVTLIGVLEYAGVYCRDVADPFRHMLTVASSFLRPGGQLLIAIENKLGIKYFSGCGEDHGVPIFSGLEGYPEETGVQTFGRHELETMLRACGLVPTALVLPFPDYKIPNSFINAAHAGPHDAVRFDLIDWCRKPFQDYMHKRAYLFDDHLALGELAKNGLLADHSNSFLMIATKGEPAGKAPIAPLDWIATRYNVTRHPRFRTTTRLLVAGGQPTVVKEPMGESPVSAASAPNALEHILAKEPFVENAESMAMAMLRAFRKKEGAERAVTTLLREWLAVLGRLNGPAGDVSTVKGELIDCIPDNLLRSQGSPWQFIDREWRWPVPVSVDWIVYRGLSSFWNHHALAVAGLESFKSSSCDAFIARCFELLGPFEADAFEQLRQQEHVLQTMVLHGPGAPRDAGLKAQGRPARGFVITGRTFVSPITPSTADTPQPVDTFAQLYIDDGSGFSEEHSIQIPVAGTDEELEFDVSSYPKIRGLRLDPINCPAVIELRQFRFVTRADVCLDLAPGAHYQPNGTILPGGKILFRDGDPQIAILRSIPGDLQQLRAAIRYLAIGPDVRSY